MGAGKKYEGFSRAEALRKGILGAGALLGLDAFGPSVRRVLALAGDNDADTLNLLLLFEYMEIEYLEESKSRLRAGRELRQLVARLSDEEHAHVESLSREVRKVGGKPLAHDRDFATFSYRYWYIDIYLQHGWELEKAVISAYNGAIPLLRSREARRVASSIVQVEGRHAAALSMRGGEEPAPEAFDPVSTEYQALRSVIKWAGPVKSPSG